MQPDGSFPVALVGHSRRAHACRRPSTASPPRKHRSTRHDTLCATPFARFLPTAPPSHHRKHDPIGSWDATTMPMDAREMQQCRAKAARQRTARSQQQHAMPAAVTGHKHGTSQHRLLSWKATKHTDQQLVEIRWPWHRCPSSRPRQAAKNLFCFSVRLHQHTLLAMPSCPSLDRQRGLFYHGAPFV